MSELFSIDAEQAVLGGVMLDDQAYHRVNLSDSDFGRTDHRPIWRAVVALREAGEPTDCVTVADWLDANGEHRGGGPWIAYLGELVNEVPSAANVAGHARIVRDLSMRRTLLSTSTALADAAKDRTRSLTEIVDESQRTVLSITETGADSKLCPVADSLSDFLDDTERRFESDNGMVGLPTGHVDVDGLIHGFEGGDFVVLAGRPSMGKTMLASQWAEHMSQSGAVAFFSLEMPRMQLIIRMATRFARIPYKRLRSGQLEDGDWPKLSSAIPQIKALPIYVDDTACLTLAELRSRARMLHNRKGLRAIFVDYLQILQPGEIVARTDRADMRIGAVSTGLKNLAKELDVPVIALAQLNRGLEQRNDKRPHMADLREAGQIEQDADVIAFIYRDEVYDPETPRSGIAEILVRKQRNGPTGTVHLRFLGDYQRFENLASEDAWKLREPMKKGGARGVPGYDRAAGE